MYRYTSFFPLCILTHNNFCYKLRTEPHLICIILFPLLNIVHKTRREHLTAKRSCASHGFGESMPFRPRNILVPLHPCAPTTPCGFYSCDALREVERNGSTGCMTPQSMHAILFGEIENQVPFHIQFRDFCRE